MSAFGAVFQRELALLWAGGGALTPLGYFLGTTMLVPLAMGLGVDPRPFVVAVMLAASNAFATPIGYQTNTFVYNAGGYKFADFVKIGLPLNIITWLAASLLIPYFFPL